jgi:hypothetical protein
MRWLRVPPVVAAALLLGLLGTAPAAAQPDHLHLDLSLVGCGTLQATGFEMPKQTRLDLRFVNAANGAALHQATPTTDAAGSVVVNAEVELAGVRTVRATVTRPGESKPFAFSELTIAGECPLPFTGPARWPTLTGLALALIVAGSALLRLSPHRGRHRAAAT